MTDAPPPRTGLSRRSKIALAVLGLLVALPALALFAVLHYDWNRARPWLNARTSEAIGRPFAINGELTLTWEKPSVNMAERDRTWRDFIPWPHLLAKDVHVGNPAGMSGPDMASVRALSFSLNPVALLSKNIVVPVLRFDAPVVDLRRTADNKNNWTFRHADKPSPWRLDLERVVFTKGVVHLADAIEKADLSADIDTINADPAYGISWKLHGKFNGAPVTGTGKAGAVLSLKQQDTPFPVQADMRAGGTRVVVEGTLTKPTALAALDLHLKVSGPSMARLYPFVGLTLPETPAYSTEGRLSGSIGKAGSRWTYDKFKGKVGSSDIGGRLEFQTGKPRGKLSGDVVSHLLQFADLGPLIGADSNESKEKRGVAAVQPAGKVLPVEPFRTERWNAMDADIKFTADHIVRKAQLPIKKLSTHLVMTNGVLTLNPLVFDIAGGNLNSNIKLDGSGREGKNAILATARVSARHIRIKELFPKIPDMQATVGEINGDAQLSAQGNSVASLLAGANGEVKALVNQGQISKLLLEEMGLNIGNIILTKLFGDKQIKLNCMASDFDVTKGLMQTRMFVVDTEEAIITADGTINLADEQLNMTLRPDTKSLRIFSLRAPLHLKGTFSNPDVSVDKGVLALKAGGALALAALAAPAAALVPLINTGPGENSECARLLAVAREKPVAPAPGKTQKQR